MFSKNPLQPKDGNMLKVLTIGRISTPHQDMAMIEAQYFEVQRTLESIYDKPFDLTTLGEQASGENVLRSTFLEAIELIETGQFDLAILFDLSKASRSQQFMWMFINMCVDHGTRFISIGDNIDTADPTWEISAGAATLIHGTHIQHTRHRVKAQGDAAFDKGGMVTKIPFGYRKISEDEAAAGANGSAGLRMAKIDEDTPVIRGMMDRVLAGNTYESISAWLNDQDVPTGPYVEAERWNGKRVRKLLRNPLIHGERVRSRDQIIRRRTDGKKIRRRNDSPTTKVWPVLAHLTPDEHYELIAEMDRRVAAHPRRQRAKIEPKGRARSKTLFPGQLMTCGVCGSPFYWRGNIGLQCSNRGDPDKGECWNHVQVNGDIARTRIRNLLLGLCDDRHDLKETLVKTALAECERLRGRGDRETDRIQADIKRLQKEQGNLVDMIRHAGEIDVLIEPMQRTTIQLDRANKKLATLQKQSDVAPVIADADTVEAHLPDILDYLLANSYDFSALLRRVIPKFIVHPLQAVDSGKPVARAQVTFNFAALADRDPAREYKPRPGDFSVTLDLFDRPAHVRCLDAAVRLHEEHPAWSAEKIATAITESTGQKIERCSVRGALKLHKIMQDLAAVEPYVPITDPASVSRWRQKNSHKARWNQTK
jgi:site-specific DNA recombinase